MIHFSQLLHESQLKTTLLVMGCIFLLACLSKWTEHTQPKQSKQMTRQLKRVMSQASKWHTTSRQDMDPVINLIHADYALAYANVARSLASEVALEKTSGIKIRDFVYQLESDQKKAVQNLVSQCPSLKPIGIFATGNAWM
jgi:hypothetical protein